MSPCLSENVSILKRILSLLKSLIILICIWLFYTRLFCVLKSCQNTSRSPFSHKVLMTKEMWQVACKLCLYCNWRTKGQTALRYRPVVDFQSSRKFPLPPKLSFTSAWYLGFLFYRAIAFHLELYKHLIQI